MKNVPFHAFCTMKDCHHVHYSRGWCRKHYERQRKYGDPTKTKRPAPRRSAP